MSKREISFLIYVSFVEHSCGCYAPLNDETYLALAEDLYFKGYLGLNKEGYYLTDRGNEIVNSNLNIT